MYRGLRMINNKNSGVLSIVYLSLILSLISFPWISWAGGEQSGGGAVHKANHVFESADEAKRHLEKLSLSEAYHNAAYLTKVIEKVRLPGIRNTYYRGDQELCINGEQVETVYPDPETGEKIVFPFEEITTDCLIWKIDRKDSSTPKTIRASWPTLDGAYWAKRRAYDFANDDEKDGRGEPWCHQYGDVFIRPPVGYEIEFRANVKSILNSTREVTVGKKNVRFFPCEAFERQREEYADYVSREKAHPQDWVQMAGGEQSGGGGKRVYKR